MSINVSLIASDSMNPSLSQGEILIWAPIEIEEICIGDILIFNSYIKWPNEKLIAHRVTDIQIDKPTGELLFETKGDSNEWNDQDNPQLKLPYIRKENIKGKVICYNNLPFKININLIVIILFSILIIYFFILCYNRSKCNCNS
jgi:signal peptidase I